MAGLTEAQIKTIVKEAVREAIESSTHECNLSAVGLTNETHIKHHLIISQAISDAGAIKSGVIKTVVASLSAGLLAVIFWAVQNYPKK